MKQLHLRPFFAIILIIGLLAINVPQTARAAGPWYVASTGDDGNDCLSPATPCATINGALSKAVNDDTIYVAVGTYTDQTPDVVLINKNITISGGWDAAFMSQTGISTIDGQSVRRGVFVNGSSLIVSLDRFIIKNGFGGVTNGGGILSITNSSIQNNEFGLGGGIYNNGPSSNLTLINVTVSGNSAFEGGGIYNNSAKLSLFNTTISDNAASGYYGGGIYSLGGNVIILNSILSGNTTNLFSPDCYFTSGSLILTGNNIISNSSNCYFTAGSGNQLDVDPLLGPFSPIPGYYPLLNGSPAIDAGDDSYCPPTDQRGVTRPQGAACDIGAYELLATIDVSIDIKPGSDTNPVNPKSKGKIPVAILSTPDFDAPSMIDISSLTFGRSGSEASLFFCNENGEDINGDGLLDLVCHYENKLTLLNIPGLGSGHLSGLTVDGLPIEGHDNVTVLD